MNKKTSALTSYKYKKIIDTIKTGFNGVRPNPRISAVLVLEAKSGAKISDILKIKMIDFTSQGIYCSFKSKEKTFIVSHNTYEYVNDYCDTNGIKDKDVIFPISERAVQKHLKIVCAYLGYEGISTHSFRKYFARNIYEKNQNNIAIVQGRLQHASPKTTKEYIGIESNSTELKNKKKYKSYNIEHRQKTVNY